MRIFKLILVLVIFGFFFYGCDLAPKMKTPELNLPSKEKFLPIQAQPRFKLTWKWWKEFNNPELNKIIEIALKNNDDLKIASSRLEEVIAFYGLKKAELYPLIGYNPGISRTKIPEAIEDKINNLTTGLAMAGGVRGIQIQSFENPQTSYSLLTSVSFELDFWGKLRNAKKAALHRVLATKAAKETIELSLVSTIVELYYTNVALQKELEIVKKLENHLENILKLQKEKEKIGLINKISVYKSQTELEKIRKLKETLEKNKKDTEVMLAFLIGKSPKDFFEGSLKITGDIPKNLKIPAMLPSEVLLSRPDIIQAEEELKATNFEIGVAKAMYFPEISLTGYLGSMSSEFKKIIENENIFWSIGASLKGPIFDFGRTKAYIKQTEARKKAALFKYIKTVKNAFKEVYSAFLEVEYQKKVFKNTSSQVKNAKNILDIVKNQYKAGLVDKITFSNIENAYLQSELSFIQAKLSLFKSYVKLYKALGGGIRNFSLIKKAEE